MGTKLRWNKIAKKLKGLETKLLETIRLGTKLSGNKIVWEQNCGVKVVGTKLSGTKSQ